ncbi:hypothetical protein ACFX13_013826 [Malus domestica]
MIDFIKYVEEWEGENLAIDDKPAVLGGVVLGDLSQSENLSATTHLPFLVSPLRTDGRRRCRGKLDVSVV